MMMLTLMQEDGGMKGFSVSDNGFVVTKNPRHPKTTTATDAENERWLRTFYAILWDGMYVR